MQIQGVVRGNRDEVMTIKQYESVLRAEPLLMDLSVELAASPALLLLSPVSTCIRLYLEKDYG